MPEKRENFRSKLKRPRLSILGKGIGPFYLLVLSQKKVRFFDCDANFIHERSLDRNTPSTLEESKQMAGLELRKEYQGHAMPTRSKPGLVAHGHGGGREDEKLRTKEFFHEVSKSVTHLLKGMTGPLILAGVDYETRMYRKENKYPYLLDQALKGNFDFVLPKALHAHALEIMKKLVHEEHMALATIDGDQTSKQAASRC